jgi:hypothetical protein
MNADPQTLAVLTDLAAVTLPIDGKTDPEAISTAVDNLTPGDLWRLYKTLAALVERARRIVGPASPLRVVMNGDHLDIQASVDLDGLKKLRTMLEKYQGILEMMQPEIDPDADILGTKE